MQLHRFSVSQHVAMLNKYTVIHQFILHDTVLITDNSYRNNRRALNICKFTSTISHLYG